MTVFTVKTTLHTIVISMWKYQLIDCNGNLSGFKPQLWVWSLLTRCTMPWNGNKKLITQKLTHSDNAGNRLTYQNPSVIFHKLSRPWLYLHSLCHTEMHGSGRILCNEQAEFFFFYFCNVKPNPICIHIQENKHVTDIHIR